MTATHHKHGALASAIRVVSGLTLLSRFAGLARDIITARIFGDTLLGSAFRAAYMVPNVFRRLFGEGALSAAFLPEYTQLHRDEPARADALASLTVRMLTLATGALTLAIEIIFAIVLLLAPRIHADAEAAAKLALSLRLMMLMLPMMPMVCITAILGGMLQVHGRFGPPAAAPILLNALQIAAGVAFYLHWTADTTLMAYIIGAAAVAASTTQIAWSLIALRGRVRWVKGFSHVRESARRVLKRFVPAMVGLGTLQLNTMLDTVLAMWPVWIGPTILGRPFPLDDRSNALLTYSQTLYQFPLGVFGIAVATAVFPMLSRCAGDLEEFTDTLRRGLRLSLFIGLPASVGLILIRHDAIFVMFSGGKSGFSSEGVDRAAAVLAGFSPAIWAYSLNHVLTRAFYARGDTTTPMRIAMSMVGLNLCLNWTLIWWLREAGLAYSTACAAVFQWIVLSILARKKLGVHPYDRATLLAFLRIAVTTALMGGAVWGVMRLMPQPVTWREHMLRLCAACGTGIAGYGVLALMLRVSELKWLLQRAPTGAASAASSMSFD